MNHGETDRFHSEADGPNLCRYLLAMENDNKKMCFFFNSYQGWLATISKTHVYGKTSSTDAIYAC